MDDFQPAYMGPWIPLRTDTMREVRGGVGAIIFDMTGSAAEAEHVMLNLPFNGNSIMDMNVGLLSGFLFELGVDVYVAKAVDFEVMARRRTSKLIEHWQWEALSSSVMASHMVPVDFEIADMIRAARATRGIDAIRQEDARPRVRRPTVRLSFAWSAIATSDTRC